MKSVPFLKVDVSERAISAAGATSICIRGLARPPRRGAALEIRFAACYHPARPKYMYCGLSGCLL